MSQKNEKVPVRDLIWTMLFCFILGIMSVLCCLGLFLYWGDLQLKADDDFVPAYIYENNLAVIRILAFGILPVMGFAFFYVGYMVWKCYRVSKLVNNAKMIRRSV
jgi:hypothetical protein